MANSILVNVYSVDNNAAFTAKAMGFPVANSMFLPVEGTVFAKDGTTRLYGIIQPIPSGLNVSQPKYYVTQTVSDLVDLANA